MGCDRFLCDYRFQRQQYPSTVLEAAPVEKIFCNGGTAHRLYRKYLEPVLHREAEKLPSTSPANAAWSLERLTGEWKRRLRPEEMRTEQAGERNAEQP